MTKLKVKQQDLEKRQSFRCAVAELHNAATLVIGDLERDVQLLDESAGGFAVTTEEPIVVEEGTSGVLHTAAGSFIVAVTNAGEFQLPASEGRPQLAQGESQRSTTTAVYRLGLERLGEVEPPPSAKAWLVGSLFHRVGGVFPANGAPLFSAVAVILVLAATPLAAVVLLWSLKHPIVTQAIPWEKIQPGSVVLSGPGPQPPRRSQRRQRPEQPPGPTPASFSPAPTHTPDVPWPRPLGDGAEAAVSAATEGLDELQRTIRSAPGADVFVLPMIVRRLQLGDEQVRELRRIVNATRQALEHIGKRKSPAGRRERAETRKRIFDAARREAFSVLTEKQREHWDEMVGSE